MSEDGPFRHYEFNPNSPSLIEDMQVRVQSEFEKIENSEEIINPNEILFFQVRCHSSVARRIQQASQIDAPFSNVADMKIVIYNLKVSDDLKAVFLDVYRKKEE